MEPKQYDAVIIGVGQAGNPLAFALVKAGWKTALIEREHVGGTCVNEGCTPTKTMVASGRVAYLARRGAEYGVQTGPVRVDMAVVRQRKQAVVDEFRNGIQHSVENTPGLDFLMGAAGFTAPNTIEVKLNDGGTALLSAPKIFLNTGVRAAIPPLPGLNEVDYLTAKTILALDQLPRQLLVLGGGYIGLEFSQMFRRFGSEVTVIQSAAQLLGREDEDVAAEVTKLMQEDGCEVLLNTKAVRVMQDEQAKLHLTVRTPTGERTLTGSHLLVATGRQPNVEPLNLAAAGVETAEKGFIKVNERLETNIPGIYALGDVKGGPAFTHIAYDDFRIIRTNLLENGNATITDRFVPYTVFIDPQLGRIGLSEGEAKAQGRKIRVAKLPMTDVARATEMGETRGFMKAVVEAETGQILGATVLGIEGGEIATLFQIAMMGKVPYTALRDAIFPHPGLAEALNNLLTNGFQT